MLFLLNDANLASLPGEREKNGIFKIHINNGAGIIAGVSIIPLRMALKVDTKYD